MQPAEVHIPAIPQHVEQKHLGRNAEVFAISWDVSGAVGKGFCAGQQFLSKLSGTEGRILLQNPGCLAGDTGSGIGGALTLAGIQLSRCSWEDLIPSYIRK